MISYLQIVNKLLHFHLSLIHARHIFKPHTFTGGPVHDGELGHLQLILRLSGDDVSAAAGPIDKNETSACCVVFTYKSTEAVSCAPPYCSEEVPENPQTESSYAQSEGCAAKRLKNKMSSQRDLKNVSNVL